MSEDDSQSKYLRPAAAQPAVPAPAPADPTPADLLTLNFAKHGWIFVAVGLLVPVLALAGAFIGWRLYSAGRREQGLPLLIVGLLVGGVRFYLYARTGYRTAW